MSSHTVQHPIRYHDLYVRIAASVIGAHIVVIFGEPLSTFEILLKSYYYPAFAISFVIAFLLITYVWWVSTFLNRKYDWEHYPLSRTLLQMLLGMVVPAFLAFFQAWFYLRLRGVNILKTTYVSHDFQYILLMLVILNAYYIAYYFFIRWKQAANALDNIKTTPDKDVLINDRDYFIVSQGAKSVPVRLGDICFIYRKEDANLLQTFDGETFFISQPLDDVQQQLTRDFFRVNRQLIITRRSIVNYKATDFGKIELILRPAFYEQAIVSQKRAKSFREWVK